IRSRNVLAVGKLAFQDGGFLAVLDEGGLLDLALLRSRLLQRDLRLAAVTQSAVARALQRGGLLLDRSLFGLRGRVGGRQQRQARRRRPWSGGGRGWFASRLLGEELERAMRGVELVGCRTRPADQLFELLRLFGELVQQSRLRGFADLVV